MALAHIPREELQAILIQLEQAMYNHIQWHNALVRTLSCHLPADKHNISAKAHKECLFGQWYYNDSPKKLRDHPGFSSIGEAHRQMHQLAAELLLTLEAGSPIEPHAYDNFSNAMERMRLELLSLKHEVEISLYTHDPLTGAINRADMLPMLRELHEMVKRKSQVCSLAMLDIDLFKNINDKFGHPVGDRILTNLVQFISESLRPYDKIFRYGGEEFLICMQHTDLLSCAERAEGLRKDIAKKSFDIGRHDSAQITLSFGIAELDSHTSVEECIDHTDKALYAAKAFGRNCTKIWDPSL